MEHVEANVQQILIQKGGNLKGNRKKEGIIQFTLLCWNIQPLFSLHFYTGGYVLLLSSCN